METIGNIVLQADENGLITLQCSRCHSRFKVECSYVNDELDKEIFCPCCGIADEIDGFYPQEFVDEAEKILEAKAEQMIADIFKGINSKHFKVKTSKPKKVDTDITIKNRDFDMYTVKVDCCDKSLGLSLSEINAGFYCPYCGRIAK